MVSDAGTRSAVGPGVRISPGTRISPGVAAGPGLTACARVTTGAGGTGCSRRRTAISACLACPGGVCGASRYPGLRFPAGRPPPQLGALSVLVHILLPGELHEFVHDLVGYRAQHDPVLVQAVVAREIQRLSEPHSRAHPGARRDLARGLE